MLTVQNLSHDPFYNQAFEEYIFTVISFFIDCIYGIGNLYTCLLYTF